MHEYINSPSIADAIFSHSRLSWFYFPAFIPVYASESKDLHFTLANSALLAGTYWATFTGGRIIGIFAAMVCNLRQLLLICHALLIGASGKHRSPHRPLMNTSYLSGGLDTQSDIPIRSHHDRVQYLRLMCVDRHRFDGCGRVIFVWFSQWSCFRVHPYTTFLCRRHFGDYSRLISNVQ